MRINFRESVGKESTRKKKYKTKIDIVFMLMGKQVPQNTTGLTVKKKCIRSDYKRGKGKKKG